MASPPRYPDTDGDTGVGPDSESTTGTSRRVYALVIMGIALILLMVILHLTGAMGHGLHGGH